MDFVVRMFPSWIFTGADVFRTEKKEALSQYGGNVNRLFALEFFTGFRCIVQQIGKEHDHIRYIQWQCGKIVHLKVDADPFFGSLRSLWY